MVIYPLYTHMIHLAVYQSHGAGTAPVPVPPSRKELLLLLATEQVTAAFAKPDALVFRGENALGFYHPK